jgi:hypothetical protein
MSGAFHPRSFRPTLRFVFTWDIVKRPCATDWDLQIHRKCWLVQKRRHPRASYRQPSVRVPLREPVHEIRSCLLDSSRLYLLKYALQNMLSAERTSDITQHKLQHFIKAKTQTIFCDLTQGHVHFPDMFVPPTGDSIPVDILPVQLDPGLRFLQLR